MRIRVRAELALAGITVIWGTTFVLVKAVLADISAFAFISLRFLVATALLAVIYRKRVRRAALWPGVLAGGLLFGAFVLQTLGLERTTASKSAFITGLSIPMVPLASALVYRNRPRPQEVIGIIGASVGMLLMTSTSPGIWPLQMGLGDLLTFFCAIGFALHIVVVGHFASGAGFESLAVIQTATAAAAGSLLVWFVEPIRFHLTPGVALAVLGTGTVATALAYTTQAWAQQHTSASRTALLFAVEPLVAWLTSYIWTGETILFRGKVGAGLILAGILLVELTTLPQRGKAETLQDLRTS